MHSGQIAAEWVLPLHCWGKKSKNQHFGGFPAFPRDLLGGAGAHSCGCDSAENWDGYSLDLYFYFIFSEISITVSVN